MELAGRLCRHAIKIVSHALWLASQSNTHCVMFQSWACPHPVFHWIKTELAVYTPASRPLSTGKWFGGVCVFFKYIYMYVQITEANIGLNQVPSGFLRLHRDIFWVINSSIMNLQPVAWCLCQCPVSSVRSVFICEHKSNGGKIVRLFFFLAWWIVKSKYRRRRKDRRPLAARHIQ